MEFYSEHRPVLRDRTATLSDLARLKDLRTLLQSCRSRIRKLENQVWIDQSEIEEERQMARAVKSEILSLESTLTWGLIGPD